MALIEKEAVLNEIEELFTICSETIPDENGSHYVTESELITHKRIIMELPTIDAVQVVRCKDCKHRRMDGFCLLFQQNINGIATKWFKPEPDWFCADGVRKEE